nr:probable acetyltransferase NATA1-like [Ipomoea batatas]
MGTKKDRGAGMKERKEDETKMSSDVLQPHPHTDYNLQELPTNTLFFLVSPVGFLNSCAEEMKKGFDGFNKSQAGSGETKADFKHRTLLDEFLELQKILNVVISDIWFGNLVKEFVAKKRKLKTAKQRRDMLMGEILFLRRRHGYLLKCQSCDMELAKDEGKALEGIVCLDFGLDSMRYDEVQGSNGESATKGKLRIEKTPNDYLIDDKRVGKKKLYRHGRVTVKVFTSTETSISTNLFDSNPCPPFYSATALILEVSPNPFPSAVLPAGPAGFDPVYKTLHLGSAVADPESETYESPQEGDNNVVVVAGYILFYPSYSGYFEKPSIFLENLYVRECYREFGLGKMLLSAMAARAATLGFSTVDWLVVGWNVKAIEFYVGMGGQIMQDVKRFRLSGEGLKAFAKEQDEQ